MAENSGNVPFRGALVGGFYRHDVLDYIETTAKEHKSTLTSLQDEICALQKERNEARAALAEEMSRRDEMDRKNADLWQELASVNEEIIEKKRELEIKDSEIEGLRTEISGLKSALTEKDSRIDTLTADRTRLGETLAERDKLLEDYNISKLRVADIELKAYERAAQIESDAIEIGKKALMALNCSFSSTKNSFETTKNNTVRSIFDIVAELDRMKDSFIVLSRRFDGFGDSFILGLEEEIEAFGVRTVVDMDTDEENPDISNLHPST